MDEDLLIEIMLHLDLRSLNRFILTNRLAHKLSNDPRFYLKYNKNYENEEYEGDYIWTGANLKTEADLNEELEEINYNINQYHKYKNHYSLF